MNTQQQLAKAEGIGRGAAMQSATQRIDREVRDADMWGMGYKIGRSENRFGTLLVGFTLGAAFVALVPWASVARVVAGFLS